MGIFSARFNARLKGAKVTTMVVCRFSIYLSTLVKQTMSGVVLLDELKRWGGNPRQLHP